MLNAFLIIVFRKFPCAYPKQFTLLSRKHWIAWYHPIWCKLLNTNIFMSDVQTFQSVCEWKCNLNWGEKREFQWWTKPSEAAHTPQECTWLTGEYIGSPSVLASPWQPCWSVLNAIPFYSVPGFCVSRWHVFPIEECTNPSETLSTPTASNSSQPWETAALTAVT